MRGFLGGAVFQVHHLHKHGPLLQPSWPTAPWWVGLTPGWSGLTPGWFGLTPGGSGSGAGSRPGGSGSRPGGSGSRPGGAGSQLPWGDRDFGGDSSQVGQQLARVQPNQLRVLLLPSWRTALW